MRSRARSRRATPAGRRAALVVVGVLLAVTSLVAGVAQVIAASSDGRDHVRGAVAPTTSATPSAVPRALSVLAQTRPTDAVRGARVGRATAYPGSILTAPPAAVAAYQRAAVVIASAARCRLDWSVLAAIGRV